ncbi:glutamine--fructose-6-phosphate transaminase (isomerizing) [Pseudomonadales bacterium]|nr:glutamine--fructose-6-phosphate transaminase (isomerizing) [Pseudomonadales bacterium]MDC1366341.1 glutamine--fructose-6-phosphate transaminase (isomerizing) [Pseudomonadales bacterium]
MCGIVGAAAERNVVGILLEGLQRLEYRGYDSAGLTVLNAEQDLKRYRAVGKVQALKDTCRAESPNGSIGIAHTRWATHGKPTQTNAHPHVSSDTVSLVHNGIIENHEALRQELTAQGYRFESETDTEVMAHLIHRLVAGCGDFRQGVTEALTRLEGAYAIAVQHRDFPDRLIGARQGSPLVVGLGIGENFIASDPQALRPVTDRFIYLEEGELVELTQSEVSIFGGREDSVASRAVTLDSRDDAADKGTFRHFMLKEIYEQPNAIRNTLQGRIGKNSILSQAFGVEAGLLFEQTQAVQIVACGTSYYSALVAKYWVEALTGLICQVEIASEWRYRTVAVAPNTLFLTISQSGETADTLAALRQSKSIGYLGSLCICNVPNSSLVRESDLCLMTEAGTEIGVASTKAFTTQLADLLMFAMALGKYHGLTPETESELVQALHDLPTRLEETLEVDQQVKAWAEQFIAKDHALFLGRGLHYPIAMEGALKLKEISYIHAEGYPAGELKHGPLALVDEQMPVVCVAPTDELLEKVKSNLQEVAARGGSLYVFTDHQADFSDLSETQVIILPTVHPMLAPIAFVLPLQLLSYHVAVLRGTDVDQPRNLAKSVTVE